MGLDGRYSHTHKVIALLNKDDAIPEEKLWASVLVRAIFDLAHVRKPGCDRRGKPYKGGQCPVCLGKSSARWWILHSNGKNINSFPNVCDILGINPNLIREELREWLYE